MIKVFDAFNQKDLLQAAGAMWNSAEKCWTLTNEQLATIDPAALAGTRIVEPPKPMSLVDFAADESFKIERVGSFVFAMTTRGPIAWWQKVTTTTARDPRRSHYDAHRFVKGDDVEYHDEYAQGGATEQVLAAVQAQLPKAFQDAKWAVYPTSANDPFATFIFISGIAEGGCAWFGNTDKKGVSAVKRAQKSAIFNA